MFKQTIRYIARSITKPAKKLRASRLIAMPALAAALGASMSPAVAAPTFFLVVAIGTDKKAVEDVNVSLAGGTLPEATLNEAYNESLRPYLSATGDPTFDPAAARWSLAAGTLPAGLALDPTTGAIAGVPTTKTSSPASFTVLATYKGHNGQAIYTIEVAGEVLHVQKITAGAYHTCAITDTGSAKCWGANSYGQLGNNSTTSSSTPVNVVGLSSNVVALTASNYHTCALVKGGAAKCWGDNAKGQLGNNSTANSTMPVDVQGLSAHVTAISAGGNHVCAIVNSGVKCWGLNTFRQLGIAGPAQSLVPVDVPGLTSGVTVLDAGWYHSCAVINGQAKCWGFNNYGQLGDNTLDTQTTPVDVQGLGTNVLTIAAGSYYSCALVGGGGVKCWGQNHFGQLGNNTNTPSRVPVTVKGLEAGVSRLAVGDVHNCVVLAGAARCWGYNSHGQLGNNMKYDSWAPVAVLNLGDVSDITPGYRHTCAATTAGTVKCWGDNNNGQSGSSSALELLTPSDISGL